MTPEDRRLSLLKPRTPFQDEFNRILDEIDKAQTSNERRITVNTPKERLYVVAKKNGGMLHGPTEGFKFSHTDLVQFSYNKDMNEYEVFELVPRTVNTTVTIV